MYLNSRSAVERTVWEGSGGVSLWEGFEWINSVSPPWAAEDGACLSAAMLPAVSTVELLEL